MDRRGFLSLTAAACAAAAARPAGLLARGPGLLPRARPNAVVIYADDLGYGDVGCYGARRVPTPNIDALASGGRRFLNAHAPAATCTPSRYALLTGEYAWRRPGTGILRGDAPLIIQPGRTTLASMLRAAGYRTGVVGKWHLGLGTGSPDWNGSVTPGPEAVGFDESFIIPATGDRVPCVFVENGRVVNLDPADPITVRYGTPIESEPTGKGHPERLKVKPSYGHDQAIVNGISRIGYMSGGHRARWVDEEIADTLAAKAVAFIERHRAQPFFLYFATHDIHVPRVPHPRFAGATPYGPRGDVIVQLDWCVGRVVSTLERLDLAEDTLVIFTSDNGPVLDDGYQDQAVERMGAHRPAGVLRGGKYSAFDAGTRVPFVVRWPDGVRRGTSDALLSQIDLVSSLAGLVGQRLSPDEAPDSYDVLGALTGRSSRGRDHVIEHAAALSIIVGDWKYIEPHDGERVERGTNIELGNDPEPQLYDLAHDIGETRNLARVYPDRTRAMAARLAEIRARVRAVDGQR